MDSWIRVVFVLIATGITISGAVTFFALIIQKKRSTGLENTIRPNQIVAKGIRKTA